MTIQEFIEKFRQEYFEAYKDILPPEILKGGNPWFEERLRSAYLIGIEEAESLVSKNKTFYSESNNTISEVFDAVTSSLHKLKEEIKK